MLLRALTITFLCAFGAGTSHAQPLDILTNTFRSTESVLGQELARVMAPEKKPSLAPILGRGARQNLQDLLSLKEVDFAFVNADVLANLRITKPDHLAMKELAYFTKIADAELHLLVRDDSGIRSIDDLNDRAVSIGNVGSGTSLTARLMMRLFKVEAETQFFEPLAGLWALDAGSVDAVFIVGPKPIPLLKTFENRASLRLVPIPFSKRLEAVYHPVQIAKNDYPALIKETQINSISVPIVLMGRNQADQIDNNTAFGAAFLNAILELQQVRNHPKWQEIDLNAKFDGWQRMPSFARQLDGEGR